MYHRLISWLSVELFFCLNIASVVLYANFSEGIAKTLSISAADEGQLGGVYFITYAIAQFATGGLLGRLSSRWLLSISALIAAAGAFLLGHAYDFTSAMIARATAGLGFSIAFVGTIYMVQRHFPNQFSLFAPISQSLSNLSGFLVGVVVALGVLGTHYVVPFEILSGLLVVTAGLMFVVIRDDSRASSHNKDVSPSFFTTMKVVISCRQVWLSAIFFGGIFGSFLVYADMWNISFQVRVFGNAADSASIMNSSLLIGLTIGGIVTGIAGRRFGYITPSRIMSWIALVLLIVMATAIYTPTQSTVLMFMIGLFLSVGTLGLAALPQHLPETAIALGTSFVLTIVFLYGGILGYLVGTVLPNEPAWPFLIYQTAMTMIIGSVFMAALASLLFKSKIIEQ